MSKKFEKKLIMIVIAGQLLAQGFYLPVVNMFPLYLLLLVILGVYEIVNWFYCSHGRIVVNNLKGIPVIMILMLLNIILVRLLNFNFDSQRIALISFSMTLSLACYNSVDSYNDISWIIKGYILLVLLSAIVELGQFLNISFCDDLWTVLHADDRLITAKADGRYIGLASDALQFAYHCTAALALTLFIKFKKRNFLKKSVIFAILLPAVFTNNTRSAMVAIVIIFAVWLFAYNTSIKSKLTKWALIVLSFVIVFTSGKAMEIFQNSRFHSITTDAGSLSRISMVLTAFNHALHHPFGMGVYRVSPDLVVGGNSATYSYVLANTAHNLFGNCAASYGFIGLALMLILYKRVFDMYYQYLRYQVNNQTYLSIVLTIMGLMINACFHNAYLLTGDLSTFLFIGLVLAAAKPCFIKE